MILLSTFPIETAAVDSVNAERKELLNLACQLFPEYVASIRGKAEAVYSRSQTHVAEIVFCETRSVSEHEKITYAQFSNGRGIIVDESATAASLDETDSSETTFGGGKTGTLSYKITPTDERYFSGIFYLDDFKYRLISATYDCITDDGTPSVNDSIYCVFNQSTTVYQETASSSARASYNANPW